MSSKAKVTLYTRPGCHLCDEAKARILASAEPGLFTVEEVDIDQDPELKARYGHDIPVVLINGIMVFKHRLETSEFDRKLRRFARD